MASASTSSNSKDEQRLLRQLQNFTTRHTSHHVPLALVTSGGTAAPLEHNCVRYLDNFSTGTRGAYAVEEFCKRGYAVIHLKREGSVAPFGRVLANVLGCGRGGPEFDSLGELFDCDGGGVGLDAHEEGDYDETHFGLHDIDEEDDDESDEKKSSSNSDNRSVDPWMYSDNNQHQGGDNQTTKSTTSKSKQHRGELSLNPRLVNSPLLQSTLRTYKRIKSQGLLLTIDFRTVDDYLHKLQYCCEAVNTCGSLGLVYLAAAVSDFYVPDEKKALHKIQSRNYGIKSQTSSSSVGDSFGESEGGDAESAMQMQADNTLSLTLYPVPKVIPSLRKKWCPDAFVTSFKLETDISILRQKAVKAMESNNVHLVVGNELHTRYEKVFILSRKNDEFVDSLNKDQTTLSVHGNGTDEASDLPEGFHIAEVNASHGLAMSSSTSNSGTANVDALEYATIEYVVRRHFHYISTNISNGAVAATPNLASAAAKTSQHALEASALHEKRLNDAHRQLQRERLKARLAELAWNVVGSAAGIALSYGISRVLQGRQHH